jgi:hypothetical protein
VHLLNPKGTIFPTNDYPKRPGFVKGFGGRGQVVAVCEPLPHPGLLPPPFCYFLSMPIVKEYKKDYKKDRGGDGQGKGII